MNRNNCLINIVLFLCIVYVLFYKEIRENFEIFDKLKGIQTKINEKMKDAVVEGTAEIEKETAPKINKTYIVGAGYNNDIVEIRIPLTFLNKKYILSI